MPRELPVYDDKPGPDTEDSNPSEKTAWMDDTRGPLHDNDDLFVEDDTLLFDYSAAEPQPITSNHIITPPMWGPWSSWVNAGKSSKVRVRSCQAKGQEVSEMACDGIRLQIKTCGSNNGRCGETQNVTNQALQGCHQPYKNVPQDTFRKAPPPPPRIPNAPPHKELRPNPDECFYSLFDNFRQKFVFTRWNLTALITKSKVKRWCDKKSGQYLVMTTPLQHCRSYYKDLCKVS
ncbi:endonuclease domain-containing 1 protein [Elysia marginata]|uniref:Endonuclease domain-containing 1 protein n=1 Tax=Elysia marginata TaxID=1093978 RepID=A0AAV4FF98_9GAST|nr:endonuclease domain-containing 1 protein [Elysia marginata]